MFVEMTLAVMDFPWFHPYIAALGLFSGATVLLYLCLSDVKEDAKK